jgi:predicted nucleotidyltransferase
METTKNQLPTYSAYFFNNLGNYLDTKLYYFGSVQRGDYFPKSSDIDVAIFSNNVNSIVTKMQSFLNVSRNEFKNFVWRLNSNNVVVNGYKILYKEPENDFIAEFSIYDEKHRNDILFEHNDKRDLPFYATFVLIIVKFLFYTLAIIPSSWYIESKKFILTSFIGKREDNFVIV